MNTRIINDSDTLRNVTGSWWANADFSRIDRIVYGVEQELARVVGADVMQWLTEGEGRSSDAWQHAATAVGYMACMRYYRLNDISHDTGSRRVKIDRDNEARPFEWQLARDDRAHLEEYYRALDRLLSALQGVEAFTASTVYRHMQQIIVPDADTLALLTGLDPSPWLYLRLVPYLLETQHHVERAYGSPLADLGATAPTGSQAGPLLTAAQKAVALGAIALMGRRTSLQQMPYAMMQLIQSNGGGNQLLQPTLDQLTTYLRALSADQHYWLNEMRTLRDQAATVPDGSPSGYSYLQVPDNQPTDKCFRL